ncbi:MAG TPA: hypothetical protein VF647_07670 [Longimicrobium sp.]|jgi:hypothetical protein
MSMIPRDVSSARRRGALRVLAAGLAFAAVTVGCVAILHVRGTIPAARLLKDPGVFNPGPWYLGAVSYFGIALWTAACAVTLFSRTLLRNDENAELRRFLLASGLLSALLGTDDLFMLHDTIAPQLLGISEKAVIGVYGLLGLAYAIRFRSLILRTELLLLVSAIAFFGLSVCVDVLDADDARLLLVEDGAKLAGITQWFSYLASTSAAAIRGTLGAAGRHGEPELPEHAATAAL